MKYDLTEIFYLCDEFYKHFSRALIAKQIGPPPIRSRLSISELMTLVIAFHSSGFHDLKHFYLYIKLHHRRAFPGLVSYSRFVELIPRCTIYVFALMESLRASSSEVAFIDATSLAVCKNKRIYSHKVFKNLARRGKTTMGWFFRVPIEAGFNGAVFRIQATPCHK